MKWANESISICSKTLILTYKGLVYFGQDSADEKNKSLSEKGNHALIYMYQPMADKYTQSIAVFAGHGSTDRVLIA